MSTRPELWIGLLLFVGAAHGAQPPTALAECYAESANRVEIGECLNRRFAEANAELSAAVGVVREQMAKLDAATGRQLGTRAFERSQQTFIGFRAANCAWLAAEMGAGTGAGDVQRDCEIRMTRARTDELRTQVRGPASGATPEPPASEGKTASLTGSVWRLTRLLRDGQPIVIAPEPTPSIQFDDVGHVGGNAAVNRFSGGYAIDATGVLRWSPPQFVTTRMVGPAALMQQEGWFLDALTRATCVRLAGETLVLGSDDESIVLTFEH